MAAGRGERFDAKKCKQFILVNGQPLLSYTVKKFLLSPLVDKIILVLPSLDYEKNLTWYQKEFLYGKSISICPGGQTRQQSVYLGIKYIEMTFHPAEDDILFIHDGVRPMIALEDIKNLLDMTKTYGASFLCERISDSLHQVDDNNFITNTLNRKKVVFAKTPQAFTFSLIKTLHEKAQESGIKVDDDASLAFIYHVPIKAITSSGLNLKITTKQDLAYFKLWLEKDGSSNI
jgi:2-C-methyl-D-erythritol 4-phosphate cytidylyltransferase